MYYYQVCNQYKTCEYRNCHALGVWVTYLPNELFTLVNDCSLKKQPLWEYLTLTQFLIAKVIYDLVLVQGVEGINNS
jgi:hypothetical protein